MSEARSLHILHIQGDEMQAEACWEALADSGLEFQVTLATTPESYKKALEAGDVDVVLCDSCGYDFDGEEALLYVRANYPGIPVLFLSDSYANRDPHVLKSEGAVDCLSTQHLRRLAPVILQATTGALH
jgi:DNA-binding NtrC family response regulator